MESLNGSSSPFERPSRNGRDGRDARGRFTVGNPGGPGNPHGRRVGALRSALYDALTPEDIREIAQVLIQRAKSGDIGAIREVLARAVGKPEVLDRLLDAEEDAAAERAELDRF